MFLSLSLSLSVSILRFPFISVSLHFVLFSFCVSFKSVFCLLWRVLASSVCLSVCLWVSLSVSLWFFLPLSPSLSLYLSLSVPPPLRLGNAGGRRWSAGVVESLASLDSAIHGIVGSSDMPDEMNNFRECSSVVIPLVRGSHRWDWRCHLNVYVAGEPLLFLPRIEGKRDALVAASHCYTQFAIKHHQWIAMQDLGAHSVWKRYPLEERCEGFYPKPPIFGDGPIAVSASTASHTELSEFFCPHWVPERERELIAFPLSLLFVCQRELTEFFVAEFTELQNSLSSLFRNSTLETVFRPFPISDSFFFLAHSLCLKQRRSSPPNLRDRGLSRVRLQVTATGAIDRALFICTALGDSPNMVLALRTQG